MAWFKLSWAGFLAMQTAVCATTLPALAAPGWDCMLRSRVGSGTEAFQLRDVGNGHYYGGGYPFESLQNDERIFVGAMSVSGLASETGEDVVGVDTLVINKSTLLARLTKSYLKGYPDADFYGTCKPGP